ncbi:uncharacterized protein A4U43_C05F27110 [Asparagus officinalis]|uniref:Uncharacterized protein n=1 Tax=Asparagus officinalis TaxID=4686 RepID=A0A5P1EWE8_ASPOF|nr:uncharacterized protein A4U43_C05F27110 [Asparagus officinalis]
MGPIDKSSLGGEMTALSVDATENRAQAGEATNPSSRSESSRRPSKEHVGVKDVEGRAGTPSDQEENGADERILGEMPNAGIHQALQAYDV